MKIFLVTSARSDFGLFNNLITELKKKRRIKLKIVATGSHFSKKYGFSLQEIKSYNFEIYKKILITNNVSSPKTLLSDMNILSKKLSVMIKKDKPDLFILLGDRYEIFAVSFTAYVCKIPIAHIHGGEKTEGSLDDGFRHCISKLSNYHFVSHKDYKKRLIQLGENPNNIFNVGALGVENIYKTNFITKIELEKCYKISLKKKILIVCLHPEINKKLTKNLVNETLNALKHFSKSSLIFTMPGADLYNDIIFEKIEKFIKHKPNCYLFKSLGSQKFLSFLKISDAIIGNSSSGIIEMPSFKKFTINIGDRQKGRIKNPSVIDVAPDRYKIKKAINYIYSKRKNKFTNIYYKKNTSKKISSILDKIKLNRNKTFFDIKI